MENIAGILFTSNKRYEPLYERALGAGDPVHDMSLATSPPRSSMKRPHEDDSYEELADLEEPCSVPSDFVMVDSQPSGLDEGLDEVRGRSKEIEGSEGRVDLRRERSSSGELSDIGSMTPSLRGDSPTGDIGPNGMLLHL